MSVTGQNIHFHRLVELESDEDALRLGQVLREEGFASVRRFLDEFRDFLRRYEDEQCERADSLLRLGRLAFPEPGRVSPSWTYIWEEFEGIIGTKRYLLETIDHSRRSGEWQVLLDNPHSNHNIAVYPGLSFIEAIYMFAYFRTDLLNNEYIRLQRIDTVLTVMGTDQLPEV